MDEAYDALTDYHDRIEKFDPACEHTFSYLQVCCWLGLLCLCCVLLWACKWINGQPQIFSAMANSFAHGSNDVANAIGPFAAIYHIYSDMTV